MNPPKKQYRKPRKKEGKSLKARVKQICTCQAAEHKLVGNCLHCGKIVCDLEGPGLCTFCSVGTVPCENSVKSQISQDALLQKDRILQFDRENARRTTVIDDENDYFESDSRWISGKEREKRKILEQKYETEKDRLKNANLFTIDIVNKTVTREDATKYLDVEKFLPERHEPKKKELQSYNVDGMKFETLVHPCLKNKPTFLHSLFKNSNLPSKKLRESLKLQDEDLLKMVDYGKCLSLHQPWASLLVAGIKTVEGRSWYTPHRGRLWIAATSLEPSEDCINEVENSYKVLYKDPNLKFPRPYSTACLLGCVDLVEVFTIEEYKNKFKSEESQSDFVFICENPRALPVKFSVSGNSKIWNLPKELHNSARQALSSFSS